MTPFLRLLRSQLRWLALGLLLAVLCLVAGMGLLGLSGWFLAATAVAGVSAASAEAFNFFMPAAGVRFFAIARTVARWGERVITHDATFRVIGEIRVWLYARLIRLSPRQLGRYHGADLLNRLTQDIDALNNLYQRLLLPTAAALLSLALLGLLLCLHDASLFWPWAAFTLSSLLLVPALAWRLGKAPARAHVAAQAALRRDLLDAVDGLEDFSLHQPAWQQQRARVLAQDATRVSLQLRLQRRGAALRALQFALVGLTAWALIGLATDAASPWLAALVLVLLGAQEAVQALPQAFLELPGTFASAQRLDEVAAREPEPAFVSSGPQPAGYDIAVQALSFAHDPACPILEKLSLQIAAGEHLALIGPSGGGKSTLIQLLARLLDPQHGHIELGGLDLRHLDEASLRRSVACTPQENWMLTAPLAENLRLADPDADDATLWRVLALVGLEEVVAAWPEGLQTWIEEGGASLSGGQRRRLALARALLARAPVTLLDEPSEGLDPAGEAALIARVRAELQGRTLVWVSHRTQGLAGFDRVLRLENGALQPA